MIRLNFFVTYVDFNYIYFRISQSNLQKRRNQMLFVSVRSPKDSRGEKYFTPLLESVDGCQDTNASSTLAVSNIFCDI